MEIPLIQNKEEQKKGIDANIYLNSNNPESNIETKVDIRGEDN